MGDQLGRDRHARDARLAGTAARIFGTAIALVGLVHAIFGEAATRLFPFWPEVLPGRPYWAHAAGLALGVFGTMVALGRRPREAALGIAGIVALAVLALHLPRAVESAAPGNAWLSVLKFSALAAGAILVARVFPGRPHLNGAVVTRLAAWLLAAFLAYSGYVHLRHTAAVTRLLPAWMPWQMFWVAFTGVALITGGLGLLVARTARVAATLTSVMIAGFFVLVHIPRTLNDVTGSTGWLELGESTAYCMLALILATAVRGERTG